MRKLKRITALILSILMLMSMSVAVSATANTTTYPLYISNPNDGYVYTAYQIFSGEMGKDADDNEVLKVPEWSTGIDTTDIYTELAKLTLSDGTTKPFTFADGSELTSAAEVAAKLAQYTDTDDSEVAQLFADFIDDYVVGVTASYDSGSTSSGGYYTINAPAGYYLIKNTTVPSDGSATRYILAMTSTTLKGSEASLTGSLEAKSDLPKLDKDLDDTDANIGDTITYYLTASLPTDYSSYTNGYKLVFHDTPSSGLTYNAGSVEVYVYTSEANATAHTNGTQVYSGDYVVDPDTEGATSFTVTITDTKTLTTDGTTSIATDSSSLIQVIFTATLNSSAVIGGDGNPNGVYLEYSNDMYGTGTGETVPDKVITWTYQLDVTKIDADTKDTSDEKELEGAEFVLYRLNDSGEKEYVIVDSDNKVSSWTTTKADASTLVSDSTGVFSVIGLDIGTYYLEETKAPSGYNKMSDVVTIEIAAKHTTIETIGAYTYATYTETVTWLTDDATKLDELTITMTINSTTENGTGDVNNGTVAIKVTNSTGAALPSTGGIGTTIFYIVGGVLVVGAIILLITKKRMGGDDK